MKDPKNSTTSDRLACKFRRRIPFHTSSNKRHIKHNNSLTWSPLIPLIEHCLIITYFSYNNQFYEQTSGVAMDSPISPVIINIFEAFWERGPQKNIQKLEVWFHHVDDTLMIWRHDRAELRKFVNFLNNQHPNIHFTVDIEENSPS